MLRYSGSCREPNTLPCSQWGRGYPPIIEHGRRTSSPLIFIVCSSLICYHCFNLSKVQSPDIEFQRLLVRLASFDRLASIQMASEAISPTPNEARRTTTDGRMNVLKCMIVPHFFF